MERRTIIRTSLAALVASCAVATITPAAPATAAPVLASSITLDRSGGFTGRHDTFVVTGATPNGRPALRMVSTRQFLRLRGSYQPKNPCCDRYVYELTVTYRNGFHKKVSTVQGTPGVPQILWDVIGEVERVGSES
ncbi:hypothetical protein [Actinoplanes sichuanensis]|uniref:Secreted protein n=1 Tax=Actinoplanes sichuanensis TaxID=512349 RepID=A0ABW4AQ76_9ACTN|nr:hypothetical protein [Actinoplanes sichuanensis]